MTNAADSYVCWRCGISIAGHPLPLSRTAECRECTADLYVCKMCEFYDTSRAKACREPIADEVSNKERANFCEYFSLRPNAYTPKNNEEAEKAKRELEALFGAAPPDTTQDTLADQQAAQQALNDLFKK